MTKTPPPPAPDLHGVRILIVEDEYYLADDLAQALQRAGAEVIGPLPSVAEAKDAVNEGGFDCAILDMNLRGVKSFSIADTLDQLGIPFLIATGYDSASLPDRLAERPRVDKPAAPDRIVAAVRIILSRSK